MSEESINPPPLKTRERLLVTASRIFAEKGYQNTTIAEVCEQAQTNIASVNYHFQDKENLYLQAWRYAFKKDLKRYPSDGGVTEESSAEQRLAGRIRSLIARIADPESHFFAIVHKEMAVQTNLLEKILEQEIKPERRIMMDLIAQLLGENATQQQIHFCHASIVGQCFHLLQIKNIKINDSARNNVIDMNNATLFAEHVIAFSLAGIQAIRAKNALLPSSNT
jgi:TetR/AcrR family transcriptional regulator, regulator of cefoperazone and chloramphenicol sensitivity